MVKSGNDDDIRLSPKALMTLVALTLGGNFVSAAYTQLRTEPASVRPDPFTGTEGRLLSARIDALENHISALEKRVDAVRSDLNLCLNQMHRPERGG